HGNAASCDDPACSDCRSAGPLRPSVRLLHVPVPSCVGTAASRIDVSPAVARCHPAAVAAAGSAPPPLITGGGDGALRLWGARPGEEEEGAREAAQAGIGLLQHLAAAPGEAETGCQWGRLLGVLSDAPSDTPGLACTADASTGSPPAAAAGHVGQPELGPERR